jgi:hypothetical protein
MKERSSSHGRLSWRAGPQKKLVNETAGGEVAGAVRPLGLSDPGAVEIPHDNADSNELGGYEADE